MKTAYFIIVMVFLVFTSCETVVTVDIPQQAPLLVFNGIVVADETADIFRLTKSRGVLDPAYYQQFDPITDGEIILYENDIPVDTLHHVVIFSPGDYPTSFIFHSGNTYYITASGGGLDSVNAVTTVPNAITPLITAYTPNSYVDNNGNEIDELKFTIPDPASEANYYRLHIQLVNSGYEGGSISFNSNDPALNINAPSEFSGGFSGVTEASFDDHLFNGQARNFTVNMQSWGFYQGVALVVELVSMDRSAYLYDQSLKLQLENDGNPFSEPAPVFNNIKNGYGIFGSIAVARDTIY